MAIIQSGQIIRFPFAGVPAYASPNPEGMAVAHIDVTGNASGGDISGGITSIGQFLYRLELLQFTASGGTAQDSEVITLHEWATARSGLGANAFDLNWHMDELIAGAFQIYTLRETYMEMIRRFPLGRTDNIGISNILFFSGLDNTNGRVYDFDAVFTYWRKEALVLPGFLQSFMGTAFVPGGVSI